MFADQVLQKMGFGTIWRSWIQGYITTVDMSFIVYGSPTKPFHMQRGFRQENPLSPFLFVLVAEILNRLLSRALEQGVIEGIEIGKQNVSLSHL